VRDGLLVTSAETTINRPNAAGWHQGLGNERQGISWFTLKVVEGSASQFSGSSSPDISQWIGELEDCAATVE